MNFGSFRNPCQVIFQIFKNHKNSLWCFMMYLWYNNFFLYYNIWLLEFFKNGNLANNSNRETILLFGVDTFEYNNIPSFFVSPNKHTPICLLSLKNDRVETTFCWVFSCIKPVAFKTHLFTVYLIWWLLWSGLGGAGEADELVLEGTENPLGNGGCTIVTKSHSFHPILCLFNHFQHLCWRRSTRIANTESSFKTCLTLYSILF